VYLAEQRGGRVTYRGGPGRASTNVFARFKPRLERELGRDLAERILVANPTPAFTWQPRVAPGV
jgi:hypothetical protein